MKKMEQCRNFAGLRKFCNLQNFAGCEISQPAKFRILRKAFPVATVHLIHTVQVQQCSCCFLIFDFFLSHYGFGCFCNFSWLGGVYKLPMHCKTRSSPLIKVYFWLEAFSSPASFLFPPLSLIFSYFFTCQTPLEDDNSRDAWLNPLILEEEGYWLTVLR